MSNPSTGFFIKNSSNADYSDIINSFKSITNTNAAATHFFYYDTDTNSYKDLSGIFEKNDNNGNDADTTNFLTNNTDFNKIFEKK